MAAKVNIVSGLSVAPNKAWAITLSETTTALQVIATVAGALSLKPAQIMLAARCGNSEEIIQDRALLLPIYQQWVASGAQQSNKFVVRPRRQSSVAAPSSSQSATATSPAATGSSTSLSLNPTRPTRSETSPAAVSHMAPAGGPVSPRLSGAVSPRQSLTGVARSSPNVLAGQSAVDDITVQKYQGELEKVQGQIQQILQKQQQLQAAINEYDKKLMHVQVFPQNYPAGTLESLTSKKQQVTNAIGTLQQKLQAVRATEQKYMQSLNTINSMKEQAIANVELEKKQERLQKAMSTVFIYNAEAEKQLMIPDLVQTQLEAAAKTCKNPPGPPPGTNASEIEQMVYLLQCNDSSTQEKVVKIIRYLSTDDTNLSLLLQSRVVPALVNAFISAGNREDKPLLKSLVDCFLLMSGDKSYGDNLANSGLIAPTVPLLMDADDAFVAKLLQILVKIVRTDVQKEVFYHVGGMPSLLELLREGTEEQHGYSLELMSIVGFHDTEEALQVVRSGCARSIIDVIHSEKTAANQKEIAILTITQLAEVAPEMIISAGGARAVIALLTSSNDQLIHSALSSLYKMSTSNEIKQTICEGSTIAQLIRFLETDRTSQETLFGTIYLLSSVLYRQEYQKKFEELGGTSKIIHLLRGAQNSLEMQKACIKLLASTGFHSPDLEKEFLQLSSFRILLKHLGNAESNALEDQRNALTVLTNLSSKSEDVIRREGGIPFLIGLLASNDLFVVEKSLSCLTNLAEAGEAGELICDEGGLNPLLSLLSKRDERITFKAMACLAKLMDSQHNQSKLQSCQGSLSMIVQQLKSSNDLLRKYAAQLVTKLVKNNPSMAALLGELNVVPYLARLFTFGRPDQVISPIYYLSQVPANQLRILEADFIPLFLRHFRSQDNRLLDSILSVLVNLTNSNLRVVEAISTTNAVPVLIQRIAKNTDKVQSQNMTQIIVDLVQHAIQFLGNMCLKASVRYGIKADTPLQKILKNLKASTTPSLREASELSLNLLTFYVDEFDQKSGADLPSSVHDIALRAIEAARRSTDSDVQMKLLHNGLTEDSRVAGAGSVGGSVFFHQSSASSYAPRRVPSGSAAVDLGSHNFRESVYEWLKKHTGAAGRQFVQQDDEDEVRLLQSQIDELEKNTSDASDIVQRVMEDVESLKKEYELLVEEKQNIEKDIANLREQNDEMLEMEIQNKQEELEMNQSMETEVLAMLEDSQRSVEKEKQQFERTKMDNEKRIAELRAQLPGEGGDTSSQNKQRKEMARLRIEVVSHLLVNQEKYVRDLEILIFSFKQDLEVIATAPKAPFSLVAVQTLFSNISSIFPSELQLLDSLASRAKYNNPDIKFGELYNRACDHLKHYAKYSADINEALQLLMEMKKNFGFVSALDQISSRLKAQLEGTGYLDPFEGNLPPLEYYLVRPLQHIYWSAFLVDCLLKATPAGETDHRYLRSGARKLKTLAEIMESGIYQSHSENAGPSQSGSQSSLERYRGLIDLLSWNNYALCDMIGECNEIEAAIKSLIRIFASQGTISLFLKHQITKEVTETVGESTLFRSNNMPAQCLSAFSHHVGAAYLQSAIKPFLEWVFADPSLNLEINPASLGIPDDDPSLAARQQKLMEYCSRSFRFINGSCDQCPVALKNVCYLLRNIVSTRFPTSAEISVGGLFFLRYVCPCFVAPERFKLVLPGTVTKEQRRNSILISKVLQNLSNNVNFGKKEPFMMDMNQFIEDNRESMQALQARLSASFDPHSEPAGVVDENDLYELHTTLISMRKGICNKISASGQEDLLELFNSVMDALGPPLDPREAELEDTFGEGDTGRSRRSSVFRSFLSRRRSESKVEPVKVDEGVVTAEKLLLQMNYKPLLHVLGQTGFELPAIIWDVAELKEAEQICKLYVQLFDSMGCAVDCVEHVIRTEVEQSLHESTLFRSNSLAPKYVSEFSQYLGRDYLVATIRPLIQKICASNVSMELDPNKLGGDAELANKGAEVLKATCIDWFDYIASTVDQCPVQIRLACSFLKRYVGDKFPSSSLISVGGLFFLRFVCPVIVAPDRLQLVEGNLTPPQRRNLILISKVLQNLSNDVAFGVKEPFMLPLNEFITNYRSKMMALQEKLAEVPAEKVQELRKQARPSFDESQLSIVHEVAHRKQDEILTRLEEIDKKRMEEKGKGSLEVPLSDSFMAVIMQMGLPVSELLKKKEAEAAALAAQQAAEETAQ